MIFFSSFFFFFYISTVAFLCVLKLKLRLALRDTFFYGSLEGNGSILSYTRLFLKKKLICMNSYQDLRQWTLVCLHSYLFGP